MVRNSDKLSYKCSGFNSSKVRNSNIHKRTVKYRNSLADRQQDYTFISFENGGTHNRELLYISKSIWNYLLTKQITLSAEYLLSALKYSYTCKLGVTKCCGKFRMETRCFKFSRDCNTRGTTNSGSVCIQTLSPTSLMHFMEFRAE